MILDPEDRERFYKLHKALMFFVNQRLEGVEALNASSKTIVALPPDQRLKIRDALVENTSLIDEFVEENPFDFTSAELDIVRSWKHLEAGNFYVLRFLKKYTVFLTDREPSVAYGVVALNDPFEVLIRQPLPYLCKTVLLPFQGRIVYDGILSGYNLLIGPGIRRRLNETYNQAKNRYGIVTDLPWSSETPQFAPNRVASRKKQGSRGGRLAGHWRITWMENWGQVLVEEEGEGVFKFDKGRSGEFHFGHVRGDIDYRAVERDGKPAVEFSWDGTDETDPAQGRGWAIRDGDEIEGRIFFHQGNESAFRAVRNDA